MWTHRLDKEIVHEVRLVEVVGHGAPGGLGEGSGGPGVSAHICLLRIASELTV